jgi:tryptophan synthase beta subunit
MGAAERDIHSGHDANDINVPASISNQGRHPHKARLSLAARADYHAISDPIAVSVGDSLARAGAYHAAIESSHNCDDCASPVADLSTLVHSVTAPNPNQSRNSVTSTVSDTTPNQQSLAARA